ncbi:MAG TPA: nucleoside phosphorylase [Thermoflexales bacterium]|jgi:uridine phosphorylase|nr:nucleoside phosphorylase [Thermoflexales bacterium]
MIDPRIPLSEYDGPGEAVIEPSRVIAPIAGAERAVLCFFQDAIDRLVAARKLEPRFHLRSEIGSVPVYEVPVGGTKVLLTHPGVGAPLAAGFLEEMIAFGSRSVIACGGCGVLDSTLPVGHVLVPNTAVRDEGTSFHYLPPAREVAASPRAVAAIEAVLRARGVPYDLVKTWTTDALYRETRARVTRRQAEGCRTVEMEASAFFAVAQFRGIDFGQLLYAGDDVAAAEWTHRDWTRHAVRDALLEIALEVCAGM